MEARLVLQGRRSTIVATSLAWLLVLGGGRAHAQSAEAAELFDRGNKLMDEGKLAEGCDALEASNRVEPRAGSLNRLGQCREQNQQLASAWSAYKDALTRAKDPDKRKYAMDKAAALEPRLSYLTVSVSDGSRVDGLTLLRNGKPFDPMLWNQALPVDGGDYIITGRAPGVEEWQTTAHVPVEGAKVSVEVPRFKELGKLIPPPTAPVQPAAQPPPVTTPAGHEPAPAIGRFTTRRKLAIGVAGASVISVVAGAVVGRAAKAKQDDAFKRCADPAIACVQADESNALLSSAHTQAFEANVAFGIAAAAAIGAGVLWFTGAPDAEDPRRVSVAPRVAPGETGIVVLGRF